MSTEEYCRICRGEGTPEEPLFHPCKCSGSIRYVHQDCLAEWLRTSKKKPICELCKTPFSFQKIYSENMPVSIPFYLFIPKLFSTIFFATLYHLRSVLSLFVWFVLLPLFTRSFFFFALRNYNRVYSVSPLFVYVSNSTIDSFSTFNRTSFNSSLDSSSPKSIISLYSLIRSSKYLKKFSFFFSILKFIKLLLKPIGIFLTNLFSSIFSNKIFSFYFYFLKDPSKIKDYPSSPARLPSQLLEAQVITFSILLFALVLFLIREWVYEHVQINIEFHNRLERRNRNHFMIREFQRQHQVEMQLNRIVARINEEEIQNINDDDEPIHQNDRQAEPHIDVADAAVEQNDIFIFNRNDPIIPEQYPSNDELNQNNESNIANQNVNNETANKVFQDLLNFPQTSSAVGSSSRLKLNKMPISQLTYEQYCEARETLVNVCDRYLTELRSGAVHLEFSNVVNQFNFYVSQATNNVYNLDLTDISSEYFEILLRSILSEKPEIYVPLSYRKNIHKNIIQRKMDLVPGSAAKQIIEENYRILESELETLEGTNGVHTFEFAYILTLISQLPATAISSFDTFHSEYAARLSKSIANEWSNSEQVINNLAEKRAPFDIPYEGIVHLYLNLRNSIYTALFNNPGDLTDNKNWPLLYSARFPVEIDCFVFSSNYLNNSISSAQDFIGLLHSVIGSNDTDTNVINLFKPLDQYFSNTNTIGSSSDILFNSNPDVGFKKFMLSAQPTRLLTNDEDVLRHIINFNLTSASPLHFSEPLSFNNASADGSMFESTKFSEYDLLVADENNAEDAQEQVVEWPGAVDNNGMEVGNEDNSDDEEVIFDNNEEIINNNEEVIVDNNEEVIAENIDVENDNGNDINDDDIEVLNDLDDAFVLFGIRGPIINLFRNSALAVSALHLVLTVFICFPFIIGTIPLYFLSSLSLNDFILPLLVFKLVMDSIISFFIGIVCEALVLVFYVTGSYLPKHIDTKVWRTFADSKFSNISELFLNFKKSYVSLDLKERSWNYILHFYKDSSLTDTDRLAAILTGYLVLILLGNIYVSSRGYFYKKGYRIGPVEDKFIKALIEIGYIFKVIFIMGLELSVFPVYCGILIDMATLAAFENASIGSRILFTLKNPVSSAFIHWVCGTCFMFHLALFVTMCREIVRPGVLYFIRDQNDPNFHPIGDVLRKSLVTQLERILISAVIYFILIVGCMGSVTFFLSLFPGLLPLHMSYSGLLFDSPLDLIVYFLFAISMYKNVSIVPLIKSKLKDFFIRACSLLRLTDFILGTRVQSEMGSLHYANLFTLASIKETEIEASFNDPVEITEMDFTKNSIYFVRDGNFVRAPDSDTSIRDTSKLFLPVSEDDKPLDNVGFAEIFKKNDYTVVYMPPAFKYRIFILLSLIGTVVYGFLGIFFVASIFLGRLVFNDILSKGVTVHDAHCFTLGCSLVIGILYCYQYYLFNHSQLVQMFSRFSVGSSTKYGSIGLFGKFLFQLLKLIYVWTFFYLIIPTLTAYIFNLYFAIHFKTSDSKGSMLLFYFSQDWAVGILLLKIFASLSSLNENSFYSRIMRRIWTNGWYKPDVMLATKYVILPCTVTFISLLVIPLSLPYALSRFNFLNDILVENGKITVEERSAFFYRISYPVFLFHLLILYLSYKLWRKWTVWRTTVRDDIYLVGEQLRNLE